LRHSSQRQGEKIDREAGLQIDQISVNLNGAFWPIQATQRQQKFAVDLGDNFFSRW
jgi:hypothetical protein